MSEVRSDFHRARLAEKQALATKINDTLPEPLQGKVIFSVHKGQLKVKKLNP